MLDDFDGQFSDDVSKLSKLRKKVVSRNAVVAAAVIACQDGMSRELGDVVTCALCIIDHSEALLTFVQTQFRIRLCSHFQALIVTYYSLVSRNITLNCSFACIFTTHECRMVMFLCLTFQSLDLESSFLVCRYIFRISRSGFYSVSSQGQLKSQKQKVCGCVSCSGAKFQILDLEHSFLLCRYTFEIPRSGSYTV